MLDWDERSSAGRYVRENCKPIHRYNMSPESEDHRQLFELICGLLEYEPNNRLTLPEALDHQFFRKLHPSQKLHELETRRSGSLAHGHNRRRSSGSCSDRSSVSSASSSAGGGIDNFHNSHQSRGSNKKDAVVRGQQELNSVYHSSSSYGLSRF